MDLHALDEILLVWGKKRPWGRLPETIVPPGLNVASGLLPESR